jgi:hypothetical protein
MRRLLFAVVAFVGLVVVGVGLPFCGTQTETAHEKCDLGAPERSETALVGWSWWPIGTKCTLVEADGTRRAAVVPPWRGQAWSSED